MRWAGFVRNVMLGREGLDRETLLGIVERAGGRDVRNHLTTGNVTFDAAPSRAAAVGRRAEAAIAAVIGRPEPMILREVSWLRAVVEDDPFAPYRDGDAALEVGFLPLTGEPLDPDRLPDPGRTVLVRVGRREVWTARPPEGGRRPHVVSLLEAATGARATSRGSSTLERIVRAGDA
ncbi:MAG TPA: DUF1697 domain-containing protein [Nocardioides sp.]|nr:DUF1697 domain-containing protein [Nocardioides sp.]